MVSQFPLRTLVADILVWRHILPSLICRYCFHYLQFNNKPKNVTLYYSKNTFRMVGHPFSCPDKNRQIYGHGWYLCSGIWCYINILIYTQFSYLSESFYCIELYLDISTWKVWNPKELCICRSNSTIINIVYIYHYI